MEKFQKANREKLRHSKPYEERTKEELIALAQEKGIPNAANKPKNKLLKELRGR